MLKIFIAAILAVVVAVTAGPVAEETRPEEIQAEFHPAEEFHPTATPYPLWGSMPPAVWEETITPAYPGPEFTPPPAGYP